MRKEMVLITVLLLLTSCAQSAFSQPEAFPLSSANSTATISAQSAVLSENEVRQRYADRGDTVYDVRTSTCDNSTVICYEPAEYKTKNDISKRYFDWVDSKTGNVRFIGSLANEQIDTYYVEQSLFR